MLWLLEIIHAPQTEIKKTIQTWMHTIYFQPHNISSVCMFVKKSISKSANVFIFALKNVRYDFIRFYMFKLKSIRAVNATTVAFASSFIASPNNQHHPWCHIFQHVFFIVFFLWSEAKPLDLSKMRFIFFTA